jgi:hypothetical protein
MGYAILLDGERVAHVSSDEAVSAWIANAAGAGSRRYLRT